MSDAAQTRCPKPPTPGEYHRRVIRTKAVSAMTGYSRVQIWRKSRDPNDDFPAGIELGPNATGWFEDEVVAWLESRPRLLNGTEQAA